MLPYFYIIYLIVCIKCTICYEYYDTNSNQIYIGRRNAGQFKRNIDGKQDNQLLDDKDPVAQFDVARFIQSSDEEAVEDDAPYAYRKRNEYSDYGSLAEANIQESVKVHDKSEDYLNSGQYEAELDEVSSNNAANSKSLNINALNDADNGKLQEHEKKMVKKYHDEVPIDLIHNPEKKCSFKNMKFPFFFHDKSETTKKQKKRKMFSFHNKKVVGNRSKSTYFPEPLTKNKRSYENKLSFCPACRRKFVMKNYADVDRQKRVTDRNLHNSRQFYAALNERTEEKARNIDNNFNTDSDKEYSDITVSVDNDRRKRESIEENEKRLNELADIKKKLSTDNLSNSLKQN